MGATRPYFKNKNAMITGAQIIKDDITLVDSLLF